MKLSNYIAGKWVEGKGDGKELFNAINGEVVAEATSEGIDFGEMLDYGRRVGNPALRSLTFHERGRMLKALALHLLKNKEVYYELSAATGATRRDSWVDIEGGIGNVFSNASLRRQFPNTPFSLDGDMVPLSKTGNFVGHHIMTPKTGVAVHINAFNFPIWGMLEKVAVNWMAGVPAVVKPATITSFLAEKVARDIIDSGILPEGALQIICGSANGILDYVESQDVVTFTGSASTGHMLKKHDRVIEQSVPFNLEADSLNSSVLGTDAKPGSVEFDLFVKEVQKEMVMKCGQRCTGIRKALVPAEYLEDFQLALSARLDGIVIGDPSIEEVRMGALAGKSQVEEVRERVSELSTEQKIVYGDLEKVKLNGADPKKGAFLSPIVMLNEDPMKAKKVHSVEAFGPVVTILPYEDTAQAIEIANMGQGSLCCSIVTGDNDIAREFTLGTAPYHGRILVLNEECAKENTGHGSPLANLVHGGPGRAGGGEEMGGKRGVMHYMQRTAIQGSPTTITRISSVYQVGAEQPESVPHSFRKHFEELEVGDTVFTHKRTITEGDIVNFANVSWDHFYAHTDTTSLEGTIFEERVAHGYFILSAAAGLFVDPGKGPVLLNYGIEECRFTKPVYAGATIGVKFTVKEKIDQEKRDEEDIAKGIVKFLVDVYDETGETVAIATILTMVKKLDQS